MGAILNGPEIGPEKPNMIKQVYVENLTAATSVDAVIKLFSKFGGVVAAHIAVDRTDQKLRGFGFVTMATADGARAAIQSLHGKQAGTHALIVRPASAREILGASPKSRKRASAKVDSGEVTPGD
jgi:cold-inducible RNA-binding protein